MIGSTNAAFFLLGALVAVSATGTTCPKSTLGDAKKLDAALADLAINFHKKVSEVKPEKNVVTSPVSVALALALLESGADGETRDKIKQLLTKSVGTSQPIDVLTSHSALQKQLVTGASDDKAKVTVANALFPNKTFELKDTFVTTLRDCFESEVQKVDFKNQLEESRQKINQWVSSKTWDKIPELFKPGVLARDTVSVLANALYFKAQWRIAFDGEVTKPGAFYRLGREQQTVQFMKQTAQLNFVAKGEDKFQTVALPYKNEDFNFLIMLPQARDGLPALERALTGEKFKSAIALLEEAKPQKVQLSLPRFGVRLSTDLKEPLKKLGLDVLFNDHADFGRMTSKPLKVSGAVHEAFITVNENGTEAAAATGIGQVSGSMSRPIEVTVDHPFLYAIMHKPTGAVLFFGKVNYVEEIN